MLMGLLRGVNYRLAYHFRVIKRSRLAGKIPITSLSWLATLLGYFYIILLLQERMVKSAPYSNGLPSRLKKAPCPWQSEIDSTSIKGLSQLFSGQNTNTSYFMEAQQVLTMMEVLLRGPHEDIKRCSYQLQICGSLD